MSSLSTHFPAAILSTLLLATALPTHAADDSAATAGVSKIRVVRLSEVKGVVQMDRAIGRGFEPAMANMPIVEKSRLRTGQGVAEVEFEDNSSLRLAPDSEVEFSQLERTATGATLSSVHVVKGTVYASTVKTKGNSFDLLFGEQKLEVPPATRIRLAMQDNAAKVAVLDGALRIQSAAGTEDVTKKKTITFALLAQNPPEVARDVVESPFDAWDKQSSEYHARAANSSSLLSSSSYAYGSNDMMYYGDFANAAGCGSMWRPYFASAAWSPYTNGAWAYYGSAGYSWVSPYPWGWTPYHTGSWAFCPGTGWGWMPGGSWSGLNNSAMLFNNPTNTPGGGAPHPAPVHPPHTGDASVIAVNTRPLVSSGMARSDTFLFQRDSAGFGIPRETLGRLGRISRETDQKGFALAPIYITRSGASGGGAGRPASTMAPPVMHLGYAPGDDLNMSAEGGMPGRPSSYPGASRPSSTMSAPASSHSGPSVSGGPAPSAGGGKPR